jgi:hypothetical protein
MNSDRRLVMTLAALIPAGLLDTQAALAADSASSGRLPATNPLHRYVGSWRGQVTVEAGSGKPKTYQQENRFAWTLGGAFLEERGSGSDGSSFVGLWAFDTKSGKYLAHYFMAPAGDVVALRHEWVEAKQSFVGTADLGGGVQMLAEDRFTSVDSYEWSIIIQDAKGAVLTRMRGQERRVRR